MAQSGFTPILIYASGTSSNVPSPSNLTNSAAGAELALNYADGKLFYKDSGGTVQILASKSNTVTSTTTQVVYNNAGSLVGSANMTFNGTVLSSSFAGPVAATTLSASSTVSGAGFITYLASPPAIGGTAAAAGAFTTLSASSTVSGTGFITYLASPPAIGGTTAAAGSFTTLSASSTVSGTGFSNYLTSYLASPAAIGGTTPAAITGTTITASTSFAGALNGTVGATTPNSGAFTTLSSSGLIQVYAPSAAAISGVATLTNANLQAVIVSATGGSYTITMPTALTLDSLVSWSGANFGVDFYIMSTATGTITMANNSGVSIAGSTSVPASTSAAFRIRRVSAGSYIVYRIA